uniref:Uncharacterized protein n=1 Tax=Oryzias latipes TaxID=8090 RepID=A0A3P9LNA2_ORYLA
MRVFCAVVSTSCVVSEMGLVVGCQVVVENMVFAPTCVHRPTPEERGIPVDAPAMASRMLPRNLEDVGLITPDDPELSSLLVTGLTGLTFGKNFSKASCRKVLQSG